MDAGEKLRALLQAESKGRNFRLFFYTSPYLRCKQVGGWLAKCTPEAWRLVGSGVWVCLLSQHQPCAASRHVPVGCPDVCGVRAAPISISVLLCERYAVQHDVLCSSWMVEWNAGASATSVDPGCKRVCLISIPGCRPLRAWCKPSPPTSCSECRRRCSCGSRTLATSRVGGSEFGKARRVSLQRACYTGEQLAGTELPQGN